VCGYSTQKCKFRIVKWEYHEKKYGNELFFLKKRTLRKNQEIILDSCACHNKEAYSFTE